MLSILPLQSAQEPVLDLVLVWILHSGDHRFHLILRELSRPVGEVEVCFPQHLCTYPGRPLNCPDGKGCFPPPLSAGVECSQLRWSFSGLSRGRPAAPEAAGRPPVAEKTTAWEVRVFPTRRKRKWTSQHMALSATFQSVTRAEGFEKLYCNNIFETTEELVACISSY